MEVGVQLIGILLRVLKILLAPLYWFWARDNRRVSPITNPLLLQSVSELAAAIRRGELTSEQLVTIYIERVKEVNPLLNAVVDERYKAATEDAKAVDRQIQEAKKNGHFEQLVKDKPLFGVPFTVKESCSLAGLSNSVGCLEHAGRRATTDGTVVANLKKAGGIPLLVSNTPELCLGWETTNLLQGTTKNPYCLSRTPGGSSGGEAALLASGATPFSVASDIAGSIRLPAAFCGVFGHKPTPGIIPIEGHIPTLNDERFPKFLGFGPMTRKAEDLPLLLKIMAGDNKDALRLDDPVDMKNVKVHYVLEASKSIAFLRVGTCVTDAILNAAKYLETECGATVTKGEFKDLEHSVEMSMSLFFAMKDIPNLLQDPANPKCDKSLLVEIIKVIFGGGSRSLQGLGFAMIKNTQLFIPEGRRGYYHRKAEELRRNMERVLGSDGVLLYPVSVGAAYRHHEVFLRASEVMYTMLFNVLGMPAAAVPVAADGGMPIAVQVIAAPHQDRLCLAVAKQLEIGFGGWKPPQ